MRRPEAIFAAGLAFLAGPLAPSRGEQVMNVKTEEALRPAQIRQRIVRHRTAEVTLTVLAPDGRPLANAPVTVRQVRHKFLFGCNAYMLGRCGDPKLEAAYRRRFAAILNYATLPFYWGSYEGEEGKTAADRLRKMAQWCARNGIRTKGHPLCWHEVVPGWLAAKPPAEVEALQWARITREVKGFAGLIDTWDVVNEAVVMPDQKWQGNPIKKLCRRIGRVKLIGQAFDHARKANPKTTLLLNDFMTTPAYAKLLSDCLAAGVRIDVVGIQSHMHAGYWGAQRAWEVCQRFAEIGKPLHFTEATLVSGRLKTDSDWHSRRPDWTTTAAGEKRQAEQVAEFYTVLFSHPAVEAITWWDFSDLGAWQGAPAGFVRKDMSPKPSYDALKELIRKQWWTGPLKLTTDEKGKVRFRGFLGEYALEAGAARASFALRKAGKVAKRAKPAPQSDNRPR
jgi:endo-1,4-beta-xylanase